MAATPDPGVVRAALARDDTIDIVTTGARTGEPRLVEIWFRWLPDEPDYPLVITGTPGGSSGGRPVPQRGWLANLRAHPGFLFCFKQSIEMELEATATEIVDLTVRRRLLGHESMSWYLERAGLDAMVAGAPLVAVSLAGVDLRN